MRAAARILFICTLPALATFAFGQSYTIGPQGTWSGPCLQPQPTQPPTGPVVSGCVTGYTFRPGAVDVTVSAYGLGSASTVQALACRTQTSCPAASAAVGATTVATGNSPALFSPHLSLPAPAGISRLCATALEFQPSVPKPGQPPTSPLKSTLLDCHMISPPLAAAASTFSITPSLQGLKIDGWFIDLATNNAAQIILGRGATPPSVITALANGTNSASQSSWPGFSNQHGFTATLPYVGAPATTSLCAWLAPTSGSALGAPLQCFTYQERTAAFAAAHTTRGKPLQVSLRNVTSGAVVSVNLRAASGYFMLPWTNPAIWAGTADQAGSVDLSIATDQLPPGTYLVAYHCSPECPWGNLNANQLKSGQPWTGSITFGPQVMIDPAVTRKLGATMLNKSRVRVAGQGFGAGESIGVMVVPQLINFEGFPSEVAGIAYTKAKSNGTFSVDIDVTGLTFHGPRNQVIVLDHSRQPVAAALFTAP